MSVKVGVRVRPFNKRQEQLGSRRCIEMEGHTTHIIDDEGNQKSFVYDYSFWSHDKFLVDPDGVNLPVDDKYCDQQRVYREIGSDILINAWQGYNCCLFAYGQTGSGKSYSMIGYGANRGIIPIVCDQIFKKIYNNQDVSRQFQVKISMMEIYNQAVRDLLVKGNKKTELKICQHKTLGVYVDGLIKQNVDSYEMIAKKIEEGSNNRSIAATLMNQSSSRSHTIVSINFIQKIQVTLSQTSVKYSCIHLVDLAGSECVAKTGADSKDRLRETAKINQSLTTLGRVIQILAENCSKKEKDKTFVPYRDSKLTFILRNALGGNSRTAMMCAISPSDDNYEETLSTLRYASRAKKIENRAIVNESDVDKLIRMLREQNEMLKKMLQQTKFTKTVINYDMSSVNELNQNMIEYGITGRQQEESLLDNMDTSNYDDFEKNMNESNHLNESVLEFPSPRKVNQKLPYITNVSEDELLSFRLKYSCENLLIGNKTGIPKPDVILTALGIQPNHARITFHTQLQKIYIEALDEMALNYTYVNGVSFLSSNFKEELFHLDRVIFGTGCIFLVIFKDGKARSDTITQKSIDYFFAINQMQTMDQRSNINSSLSESIKINPFQEEELRKKIMEEIEIQFLQEKKKNQETLKKQIQEQEQLYRQKIKEIEDKKNQEAQKLKQQLQKKHEETKKIEEEKQKIQQEIEKYSKNQKQHLLVEEKQKQVFEETRTVLQSQIKELEEKMVVLEKSTIQNEEKIKGEIFQQEEIMKKELQIQTIICHNQNILTEYRLEQNKKVKNAREAKELLVKKERIELNKQLIELVPKVEEFNLIARSMEKRIECGLSIKYKYISQGETIQFLKNNSYKSKLKILIHVVNKGEQRSYYWSTETFNNRFELAKDHHQEYIKCQNSQIDPQVSFLLFQFNSQQLDPYWDPETYQTFAFSFVSLEPILFCLSFSGQITIISHSQKLGTLRITLYQIDPKNQQNISIDHPSSQSTDFKIINPRDYIEKTIYFIIQINQINIPAFGNSQNFKLQYEMLEANYKTVKYSTEIISFSDLENYKYKKMHILKDITQNTILHYSDKPIAFQCQTIQRIAPGADELTSRSSFSTIAKSSMRIPEADDQNDQQFIQNLQINQFRQISPPPKKPTSNTSSTASMPQISLINSTKNNQNLKESNNSGFFDNAEIVNKIESDYNKKKKQSESIVKQDVNMKKKKEKEKEKDCQIY